MSTDSLFPTEIRFLMGIVAGKSLSESYLDIRPNVKPESARRGGSRMYARICSKAAFHEVLEQAGVGELRLLAELQQRLNATTTLTYQGEVVTVVPDNTTRMRATELLSDLLGKRRNAIDVRTDTITILPAPRPGEQSTEEDHDAM